MIFRILLLVNLFLYGSWAQRNPQVLEISGNQVVNVGDSIDLECSVANADDFSVIWKRDDIIYSWGTTTVSRDARVSVLANDKNSTYKLTIKDARESDTGTYRCDIRGTGGDEVFKTVSIEVKTPNPTITEITPNKLQLKIIPKPDLGRLADGEVLGNVGTTQSFMCLTYNADLLFYWKKLNTIGSDAEIIAIGNNVTIQDDRFSVINKTDDNEHIHTLTIKDPQERDSGTYQCQIISPTSEIISSNIVLKVKDLNPKIVNTEDQLYLVGDPVQIPCTIQNILDNNVLWLKVLPDSRYDVIAVDEYRLTSDDRYSVHQNISTSACALSTSTLIIRDPNPKDSGIYQCDVGALISSKKNIEVKIARAKPKITGKDDAEK